MAYFAQLDASNKVVNVIVAEQDFINSQPGNWQETDINGVSPKNYAGVGFEWNAFLNGFIPLQPFPSWTLNNSTCQWEAPVAMPTDGKMYKWDESTQAWVEVVIPVVDPVVEK